MVVSNTILDAIKTNALDQFDSYTHIAVGDDNTAATAADTALGNEFFREAFIDSVKDTGAATYTFSIQLGLTEGNGNTLREVGVFDAAAAGNMALRTVLPTEFAKTADKEVWIDVAVSIAAKNV